MNIWVHNTFPTVPAQLKFKRALAKFYQMITDTYDMKSIHYLSITSKLPTHILMQVIQFNEKFVRIQRMCKNMTKRWNNDENDEKDSCLLYTSDAADD